MAKSETREPAHEYKPIAREELLARLQDRALAIVDVMPADSFKAGHIPGSINLPVSDIEVNAPVRLTDLTQEIAIYCAGLT